MFDWGGTLSIWADLDIEDMWRLAARHIAPEREADAHRALVAVEARSWERARPTSAAAASGSSSRPVPRARRRRRERGPGGGRVPASRLVDPTHPPSRRRARSVLSTLRGEGRAIGLLFEHALAPLLPRALPGARRPRDRSTAGSTPARWIHEAQPGGSRPHSTGSGSRILHERSTVGDRLYDDVWAAKQAGMRAVLGSKRPQRGLRRRTRRSHRLAVRAPGPDQRMGVIAAPGSPAGDRRSRSPAQGLPAQVCLSRQT